MYAIAVLGPDAERAASRLADAADERVGIVRTEAAETDGGVALARGSTEYVLDDGWRASGDGLSLEDALDRLAPDHEYALVLGAHDTGLPRVVIGDEAGASDAIFAASDAEGLDVTAAIESIRETEPYETLESLVAAVKRTDDADYAGAIATFTGRVRAKEDAEDERTRYLEFEKYDGIAERRMTAIEAELTEREGVLEVLLHHRTGRITDGEDIVFVVVLAGHREEAFRTVRDGINRLKDEVPLFKKEVTDEETFWVHEKG